MSDKNKDGGPAFPVPMQPNSWISGNLTVRDWFAGMALQGYIASVTQSPDCQDTAKICYEYADAMLIQREKGTKP